MRKAVILLLLPALLSLSCWMKPHPPADARHPFECHMEGAHPQIAGGPTPIRFQLINRLDQTVWMLRWNTPFEGWRGTILSVSRDGQELPYQGPMVKRGDPDAGAYMRLRAGESQIIGLDLSQGYDMSKPGLYTVKVTGGIQDVIQDGSRPPRPRDRFQAVELSCNELTLDVKQGQAENKINY